MNDKRTNGGRRELAEDGKTCRACRDWYCAGIPRPDVLPDKIASIRALCKETGFGLKPVKGALDKCEYNMDKARGLLKKQFPRSF